MRTKVSTKGQVVLPIHIRRRLGLQPGDSLGVELAGDRIILIAKGLPKRKARIIKDPITSLPLLDAGKDAAMLTGETVAEILANFP